ncbi:mandelate racemase/muconate lactonizing enzyme family protein [Rhizobium sp. LjRoot30]|uniref:mandelate racemase/muconate lactonizing enzyme family protein n=1 Tax=Rhizobium sp. LjRoot30 TaxID=3342320 RepID=UPI003ED02923
MKICKLETFTDPFVGVVRLTCEDGTMGWGQLSTYNADITATVFHRQIASWSLGRDTGDLEALVREIPEREHKFFSCAYLYRALSGLDTAIWDWRGKAAEKPVAALLGGSAGSLRAYASSMRRDITPQDEAMRLLQLRDRYGFDAFKFRIGSECGHDRDEWDGRTDSIVQTVRRTLGNDAALLVDANSCYSPRRAIEVGKMLEANGVEHFEEPCPYWEMEQTREVAAALSLDVTGGEQDFDMQHWKRMIAMKAVDIVQPDILYMGGMTRSLEVARMAEAAGLPCTPHSANLSLVTLFTMHFLRAIPNAGKYLEFSIEGPDYYPWQEGLFVDDPYTVTNGTVTVSDRPGWGVEISPDWLARSQYQKSEIAA